MLGKPLSSLIIATSSIMLAKSVFTLIESHGIENENTVIGVKNLLHDLGDFNLGVLRPLFCYTCA